MPHNLAKPNPLSAIAFAAMVSFGVFDVEAKEKSARTSEPTVSEIKLYTLPENPVCGQAVQLVAEIHTTKPGTVEFVLHRRVGRSQRASLTTINHDGNNVERWSREFVYKNSVMREYMIAVKGQQFATDWVPVNVSCGDSGKYHGVASLLSK